MDRWFHPQRFWFSRSGMDQSLHFNTSPGGGDATCPGVTEPVSSTKMRVTEREGTENQVQTWCVQSRWRVMNPEGGLFSRPGSQPTSHPWVTSCSTELHEQAQRFIVQWRSSLMENSFPSFCLIPISLPTDNFCPWIYQNRVSYKMLIEMSKKTENQTEMKHKTVFLDLESAPHPPVISQR